MPTVFYILASVAAVLIIIAVPLVAIRALLLMERMEDTRRDLATLIAEATLSLQQANRVLSRLQEGVDRMRHAVDHLDKMLSMLQPATAVGGILAGARRMFSGHRRPAPTPAAPDNTEEGASS